jgi:zinc transport system substrate-binding protein
MSNLNLLINSQRLRFFLAFSVLILAAGCQPAQETPALAEAQKTFRVVAASYPLQYLAQRIVGGKVQVDFPVPTDVDPREWSPSIEQVQELQAADLVIVNGAGAAYAKWLVRVSLVPSKICNSVDDLDISDYFMVNDYQIVHTHGPEGEHSHAYMVPYSWLDPVIAKKQASKIAKELKKAYPEFESDFSENLKALQADLDQLAVEFKESKTTGSVVSTNPNAKYLLRALGFEDQHLLLFDFEKQAQADALTRIERMGDQKISGLIWVEDMSASLDAPAKAKFQEWFADSNVTLTEIDLLDHAPSQGDYLSAMRELLAKFNSAQ